MRSPKAVVGGVFDWSTRIDVADPNRKVDPTWKSPANSPLYVAVQGRQYTDARLPLTKYVGIYSNPSKIITIDVDIHKDKLVAKLPAFPDGIALTPAVENRSIVGASPVTLEFEIVDSRVSSATLTEGDGSGNARRPQNSKLKPSSDGSRYVYFSI
jgi:hypothetical protein